MSFPFGAWFRGLFNPAQLDTTTPVVGAKPLWEQFSRIGGGITPADVTNVMRDADGGQPYRLCNLANESRQKDGHMQGVCGTRDRAVALIDLEFVAPEDANPLDDEAVKLCRRIFDEFRNWPDLVEHLGGSYFHGHATAEIEWARTGDGLLIPRSARPLHANGFIFERETGALRYARNRGDQVGVDLLADNPGRIVQLQRRIVGDVQAREGMARLLVWMALFRNWDLRDLISLAEIAWKPWRLGGYDPGTHQNHIDALVYAAERIGTTGTAVIPSNTTLDVKWPAGGGSTTGAGHMELFDMLGREMSKAVLGQTTTIEASPNGDRASTETRDKVRGDIREQDCRAVASVLYWHMFVPAVAVNLGDKARCPAVYFDTAESKDQNQFAQMINALRLAGVRIPAKWVREQVGMPDPEEGDELVNGKAQRAEDARTLAFMARAFRDSAMRVKNLPKIALDDFELDIEEDLSLFEQVPGGGSAEEAA